MTTKRIFYIFLVLFVAGTAALAGAAGGAYAVYRIEHQNLVQTVQNLENTSPSIVAPVESTASSGIFVENSDVQTTITRAVSQVGPAVVTVVGTQTAQFSPFGGSSSAEVSGSGVFISDKGYILTNNHVVEGTSSQWIILADGSRQDVQVIGTDQYADLAVLKTEGSVPAVATLGNSDALDPGETVIAIGSPLGDFKNSVTVGVVSATGRSIDTGDGYSIEGLIQTDAAINSGNSGGPLVNLAGEVVAINTLVVRSSGSGAIAEGLGFAIPANTASAVAGQIIATGHFYRPNLGIEGQSFTAAIARRYRLPVDYGVYVTGVDRGGPADKAGIQEGDIITSIGGITLDETNSYINILFKFEPGQQVQVGINRDGKAMQVQVTLGEE